MKPDLLESSVVHADETVVQVLHEPGRKAKTDSRMWAYCNGKLNDKSVILFEYTPTRNGDNAARFHLGFIEHRDLLGICARFLFTKFLEINETIDVTVKKIEITIESVIISLFGVS